MYKLKGFTLTFSTLEMMLLSARCFYRLSMRSSTAIRWGSFIEISSQRTYCVVVMGNGSVSRTLDSPRQSGSLQTLGGESLAYVYMTAILTI